MTTSKATPSARGSGGPGAALRERLVAAARAQLREAAGEALASAFDTLELRVLHGRAASARTRRDRQVERMREVLERDRALASAELRSEAQPASVARAEPAPPRATDAVAAACDEPIRTRSMAKLLALQGYAGRALAIYRYLLENGADDPSLRAEIAALEARLAAGEGELG